MNLAKYTAALMGAFSLSASVVQGQLVSFLSFSDVKRYKQVGPEDFDFEGGEWNIRVSDGEVAIVGVSEMELLSQHSRLIFVHWEQLR